MIDGINDTPDDAAALAALLARPARPRQPHPDEPGRPHARGSRAAPSASRPSRTALRAAGLHTTVRRNRGVEIGAACGQLAADLAGEPAPAAVARRRELLCSAARPRSALEATPERARGASRRPCARSIAASILTADFGHLYRVVRKLERAGVDRLHLDVMDGHFVPTSPSARTSWRRSGG